MHVCAHAQHYTHAATAHDCIRTHAHAQVKNGGPYNACGEGFDYTANDWTKCRADGSNCQLKCCAPAPSTVYPTTTTTDCETPTYTPPPPEPVWQRCGRWALDNDCPAGMAYVPPLSRFPCLVSFAMPGACLCRTAPMPS